ncbi:hypothetical protein ACJX0J_028960 [Zea mays]
MDFHKGELPLYSLNFGTIILNIMEGALHRKKQSEGSHVGIKVNDQDGQFDGLIPHLALISGVRTSFGIKLRRSFIQNKRTLAKNKTISQVENKLDSGNIDTVANVFETIPLNISFRRALVGHNLVSWHSLVSCLFGLVLCKIHVCFVEIFMWYLIKGVQSETGMSIQHLFIDCHFTKNIFGAWLTGRNDLVFNKITMLTSLQTVAMQFYSKYGWSFSNRIHRLREIMLSKSLSFHFLHFVCVKVHWFWVFTPDINYLIQNPNKIKEEERVFRVIVAFAA